MVFWDRIADVLNLFLCWVLDHVRVHVHCFLDLNTGFVLDLFYESLIPVAHLSLMSLDGDILDDIDPIDVLHLVDVEHLVGGPHVE